jgi:hypothetical protein
VEDSQLPENLTGASAVLRYVAPHSAANGKGRPRVREQFALSDAVSNYDGVALRIYSSVLSAFEMAPRAGFEPATNRLTVVSRGFFASAVGVCPR